MIYCAVHYYIGGQNINKWPGVSQMSEPSDWTVGKRCQPSGIIYLYKCIVKNLSLGFCEGMSVYYTLHMGIIDY